MLFTIPPVPSPPVDLKTGETWVAPPEHPVAVESVNSSQDVLFSYFKAWHIEQMRLSGNNLKERITYFYHTHLPVAWTKIGSSEWISQQKWKPISSVRWHQPS